MEVMAEILCLEIKTQMIALADSLNSLSPDPGFRDETPQGLSCWVFHILRDIEKLEAEIGEA
jgi:hypothetical protein